ncbi:CRISPR-associated protein Csx20 [Fonticella tunisiensis]|nr:CRISPR-associated protein Csx20 [Fonticella tunisiensis]
MKMLLLFSHILTQDQKVDAIKKLNIDEFIYLPEELQNIWSNINPYGELEIDKLNKIKEFIKKNIDKGDYILIQGDFGAVYHMVNFAKKEGFVPVYSTTKRAHKESTLDDNTVESIKLFKHVCFRRYV